MSTRCSGKDSNSCSTRGNRRGTHDNGKTPLHVELTTVQRDPESFIRYTLRNDQPILDGDLIIPQVCVCYVLDRDI